VQVSEALTRLYAEDLHRVPDLHPDLRGLLREAEEDPMATVLRLAPEPEATGEEGVEEEVG
jgi:hypothetical protein